MMFYILSMLISIFDLVMVIILFFTDPESRLFNYFGDQETYICLGISMVLMILGVINDTRKEKEKYGQVNE